eukprot:gene12155-5645_t
MGQTLDKPNLDKDTHCQENKYLSFAVSGMQGYRLTMEDAHNAIGEVDLKNFDENVQKDTTLSFFGIYDGHSGSEAAHYLSKHLLNKVMKYQLDSKITSSSELMASDEMIRKSYLETDSDLEKHCLQEGIFPGTTCCTVFVKRIGDDIEIICPNVGDSRSVLCKMGETVPLSYDHKPTNENEKKRILASGGFVEFGRVNGTLAVSRAFGDISYKDNKKIKPEEQAVSAEPEINRVKLNLKDVQESSEYTFIIVACDGIWDVMRNEDAVEYVKKQLDALKTDDGTQKQSDDEEDAKKSDNKLGRLCEESLDHCVLRLESKDNVSLSVILFHSKNAPKIDLKQ